MTKKAEAQETATEKLARLQREEAGLAASELELTKRISDAEHEDRAGILAAGGTLPRPEGLYADLRSVRDDRRAYRKAIASVATEADRERLQAGREAREALRPEWEKRVRDYDAALLQAKAALEKIEALNRGLREKGHGEFPHLYFAKVTLPAFSGAYPEFCRMAHAHGVILPAYKKPAAARPAQVPNPKMMAARYPRTLLRPDLPG